MKKDVLTRATTLRVVLSIITILACYTTAFAATLKKGIDVGYSNGTINWAQVKAAGIQFAILECGYGDDYTSQDDPTFAHNVAGCEANGISYGIYFYSYATNYTGNASIASEISHAKRLLSGKRPFCVYLDLEEPQNNPGALSVATRTNFAIQFCDTLKSAGYKVGVYACTSWLNNHMDATTLRNRGYSIWVADYYSYCSYTKTSYDIWQYTSSGTCPGISGSVDMNYMYNDLTNGGGSGNTSTIHVTYQTFDDVRKSWLPNVTDTQDYAGIYGHDVDCIYTNLSSGSITYRVHYKGGYWLPAVTNRSDYAGMYNYPIDGLMMTTNTGKTIHYRVHLRRTGQWLPWVTGYNTGDTNNGYAGILGQEIDAVQAYLN